MHLEVTFRNLNPREEVRKRAEALYEKLERFLDAAAEGQMTVGVEHGAAIIEVVVTSRGVTYKSQEEDPDLRTALDRAMHGLESQLRRAKEKRTNHRGQADAMAFDEADAEPV